MKTLAEAVVRLRLGDQRSSQEQLAQRVPQAFDTGPEFRIQKGGAVTTYRLVDGRVQPVEATDEPQLDAISSSLSETEVRQVVGDDGRLVELIPRFATELIDRLQLSGLPGFSVDTPDGRLYFIRREQRLEHLPSYPSYLKMLWNLGRSAVRNAQTVQPLVDDQVYEQRAEVCRRCEAWDARKGRCTKCGCFTRAKLRLAKERCPIDKWGAV